MPELREVFEMTTKQIEPDVDAWREQERHHRRSGRNRSIGAFVVAAAIGLAVVVVIVVNRPGMETTMLGASPSPTGVPDFTTASLVDLRTGDVTSLPETILGGAIYSTSPNGTMFAYGPCCSSPNPVFVAYVDGAGVNPMTRTGVDGFGASWSPDGSTLVYQRRDATTLEMGNLVVVDVSSGKTTQITELPHELYGWWYLSPTFSADGESVLFHMPRGPNDDVNTRWDIWSAPVAGGEPTLLVRNASMGVVAPDGGTLAYLDSPRGYWASSRLMIANADGSDGRVLVQGDQIEFPRWSPDGTRIAYTDVGRIHVVDVATGETSSVAEGKSADWFDEDTLVIAPE
jgi:WD40-like Beta Propeller Repeat